MPIPWIRGVQETAQLTVFFGRDLVQAPAWGEALLTRTLDEFNRLASTNRFGVRLVRSDTAPIPKGGGANVQVEVTGGNYKFFDHRGVEQQGTLNVAPGQMHGETALVSNKGGPLGKIVRAFVFLPINPLLGARSRGIGPGPKMALALHELLHACGLDKDDAGHARGDGPGDIFMTENVVLPGPDAKPELDKELAGGRLVPDAVGQFFLTARTVGLVQSVWLLGQF